MAWAHTEGNAAGLGEVVDPTGEGEHGDDALPIHGGTVADGRCRDGARIDLANGIFD